VDVDSFAPPFPSAEGLLDETESSSSPPSFPALVRERPKLFSPFSPVRRSRLSHLGSLPPLEGRRRREALDAHPSFSFPFSVRGAYLGEGIIILLPLPLRAHADRGSRPSPFLFPTGAWAVLAGRPQISLMSSPPSSLSSTMQIELLFFSFFPDLFTEDGKSREDLPPARLSRPIHSGLTFSPFFPPPGPEPVGWVFCAFSFFPSFHCERGPTQSLFPFFFFFSPPCVTVTSHPAAPPSFPLSSRPWGAMSPPSPFPRVVGRAGFFLPCRGRAPPDCVRLPFFFFGHVSFTSLSDRRFFFFFLRSARRNFLFFLLPRRRGGSRLPPLFFSFPEEDDEMSKEIGTPGFWCSGGPASVVPSFPLPSFAIRRSRRCPLDLFSPPFHGGL